MLDCCYFCVEEICQVVTLTRNVVATLCGISDQEDSLKMTATQIIQLVEEAISWQTKRLSGNEANQQVAQRLQNLIVTDRASVIEALRTYLAYRVTAKQRKPEDALSEARLLMALDVAEILTLTELLPDIESLVADVRSGEVFLPVHASGISRYLNVLQRSSKP